MSDNSLKTKTANGLLWGGISQGGQQLLNLIFGIFLARLLTAEDYGIVGMLTIFTLIANSLQESGFISALNRKEKATDADFNAVFWFNVLMALSIYALLFCCAPLIAMWFRTPVLVPLSRLVFLSFVISAMGTSVRAWLFRNMRVRETAIVTIVALVASGVTGVALAWNGFAYWGIAIQNLTYCLLMTLGSWWYNLFSVFFGRFYGEKTVGYFNQANKWTGMGYTFLTGMVWSVTQPLFARLSDAEVERKQRVFRKMLRLTAFLSMPALFGLALIAPEFIVITITEKWLPSAELMQILCVGGAFVPLASFYSNFLVSQGKSQVYMWNTISLCLLQLVLLLLFRPLGVQVMVIAYVVANTLWLLVWHVFVHRLIRLRLRDALRDVLPFVGLATISMALAWLCAQPFIANNYLSLLVKCLVAAITYFISLRLLGAEIVKECQEFLESKLGFLKRRRA